MCARCASARCAAFAGSPPHEISGACSAPPKRFSGVRTVPVHLVQVDRRILIRLTTGQEDDGLGTDPGTFALRQRTVSATWTGPACVGQPFAETTMFTLRSEPGRSTRASANSVERAEGAAGRVLARLDRVRAVHQDLWLHDRHDVGLLTERRVPRHRVRVRV